MPKLRKNPLTGRWVIVAPERAKRPQEFRKRKIEFVASDTVCPFCYGNENKTPPEIFAVRDKGSAPDTSGWHVRVVPNKFSALASEGNINSVQQSLYNIMDGVGAHEVIIENPSHDRSMADYSPAETKPVLAVYRQRLLAAGKDKRFRYTIVFKNHGAAAGASLQHPHSQLIALPIIPGQVGEEILNTRRYFDANGRCLVCDMLAEEISFKKRVVLENEDFVSFTPFASRFPFEIWILPKAHYACFAEMKEEEEASLAEVLPATLMRLKKVLGDPPYSYVIHSSPRQGRDDKKYYHWHLEIMPQLTRVAGFEWGTGCFINPVPPEEAARCLKI